MKSLNFRLPVSIPFVLVILFEIILFFRIFNTGIMVNAQDLTITVTPTVPSFTLTLTNTEVISTVTPIATPVEITPSPTDFFQENISPTPTITPTLIFPTEVITSWVSISDTLPTESIIPAQSTYYTNVLTGFMQAYLPFGILDKTPVPIETPTKALFCDDINGSISIPDNNSTGISRSITIEDRRYIVDLDVSVDVTHAWVGDLIVSIEQQDTGKVATLLDRPGVPASSLGCSQNNVKAIFDDQLSFDAEHKCASTPAAISGIFIPFVPLSRYNSDSIQGNWIFRVSDNSNASTGKLNGWCLIASLTNYPQEATPTPTPISFPSRATINGISGEPQALPLDCESRSAVDWAKYFGKTIDEINFFNKLPESDNPDKGFVGNVNGTWGQIPPNDYGVHAEPIAKVLRNYGLSAYAHRPMSWDALREELANKHPVIVWIIDSISNGIPIYYLPNDGLWTIVAHYEHTVIVTGYTPATVSYLNGDTIYTKSVDQFLDSWSALENMAIVTYP